MVVITGGVSTIWERPDAKQVVSIGDTLIQSSEAGEYSVAATDAGNTLVIEAASKKHEGEYKCKIATMESVEVTHTVTVKNPEPQHQALEIVNYSDPTSSSFELVLLLAIISIPVSYTHLTLPTILLV